MAEFEQRLQEGQPISAYPEIYPEIAFAVGVARRIARAVRPVYGIKQNEVPINEISHDFNYALDVTAEDVVRKVFAGAWRRGLHYGYATEDQGLVLPAGGQTNWMFLIDPVDGSRPANIGAEQACVNIGISKGDIKKPTLGDIEMGVVLALKEKLMFVARKGDGNPLDDVKLWQFNEDGSWSAENQISNVAAASDTLHQKAMEKIEEGFTNLARKFPKTLRFYKTF